MNKFIAAFCLILAVTGTKTVYAASETGVGASTAAEQSAAISGADAAGLVKTEGENLLIITPFFTDDYKNHIPADQYKYEDTQYELARYEVVEATIGEQTKSVEDTITYQAVEQIDSIPESCEIDATDEITGQTVTATVPLISYDYTNYRWIDSFEFPITVEDADADSYAIGNSIIPQKEEAPFAGYESELLRLINVDPEYYRIDSTEWVTEPWTREDGVVCRRALAKGSKRVADVLAYYKGMAVFKEVTGKQIRAVYTQKELDADQTMENAVVASDDQEGKYTWLDYLKQFWDMILRFMREHPAISAGLGLIILIFAVAVILHMLTRKKEKEEEEEDQ